MLGDETRPKAFLSWWENPFIIHENWQNRLSHRGPDITSNVSLAECTTEMEELYKMHKHAILDAVHQVLKILVRLTQMFRGEPVCILVRRSLTQSIGPFCFSGWKGRTEYSRAGSGDAHHSDAGFVRILNLLLQFEKQIFHVLSSNNKYRFTTLQFTSLCFTVCCLLFSERTRAEATNVFDIPTGRPPVQVRLRHIAAAHRDIAFSSLTLRKCENSLQRENWGAGDEMIRGKT